MTDDIEVIEDIEVEDTTAPGIWWSLSALKTIEACGRQYEYRYIKKAKTKPTVYLAFGKAVHQVIDTIHKKNDFTDSFWQREWDRVWYEQSTKVDWKGFKKGTFTTSGQKMLANYVDNNKDAIIVSSELKFPEKNEPYMIGPFKVRGVIDQIRNVGNHLDPIIIDFKTSGKEPDPLILRADPQWTIYWDYARKKYGYKNPELALYHLKTGKMIYTERTPEDVDIVLDSLREAQSKVDQKMFSRSIGFQCQYCDFKEMCLGPIGRLNE
jgi:CRISPR/Cas system-associated exonuclease Cas4 (RecB family)